MTTVLRQVLAVFEESCEPRTLNQLARELGIPLGTLEGMIDYWIRKGKLREASGSQECSTCGGAKGCPFVPKLPHSYELVTEPVPVSKKKPSCGGCC